MGKKNNSIEMDEKDIEAFLARGGQATDENGNSITSISTVPAPSDETVVEEFAKKKKTRKRKKKEDTSKEGGEEEGENEDEEDEGEPEVSPPNLVKPALTAARNTTNQFQTWLQEVPTPGGLMPLIFALLFFLWIAVPVNEQGHTRMYLLWLTLTGRTWLRGSKRSEGSGDYDSGADDFGQGQTDSAANGSGNTTYGSVMSMPSLSIDFTGDSFI